MSASEIRLRPLERSDLEAIRVWRNAQMGVLRQKRPLREGDQEQYWAFLQEAEYSVLFGIVRDQRLIGYCGFVHISWADRRAEVSFLLDPEYAREASPRYEQTFAAALRLLCQEAFGSRGLHRLFTETFAFRLSHIATLEAVGFRLEGRMRDHVIEAGEPVDSLIHGILETEYADDGHEG
jgi:RimJ/RimL family protein N-acetyltransferase